MEVGALIVSIISATLALTAIYISIKINKTNLNSIYFNKIFDDILIDDIPKALENLRRINGQFKDPNDTMASIIIKLEKKILFFKFKNKKFYDKLYSAIIKLDEYFVDQLDKNMTSERFVRTKSKVEKEIEAIYKIIEKEYQK